MKKLILMFLIFNLIGFQLIKSQVFKVENGLSFSQMNLSYYDGLRENLTSYSFLLGCDYLDHKYYNLSSEAGYIRKGGKEKFEYMDPTGHVLGSENFAKLRMDYIHINTTFRLKYPCKAPLNNLFTYIGFGPKVDILINSDYKQLYPQEEEIKTDINTFSFGFKPEIGFFYDYNKWRFDLNVSYLWNVGSVGKLIEFYENELKCNTLSTMLSVGYKL